MIIIFIDNLSSSILRLCNELDLSYEKGAELCGLSERYFGKIVRRKTAPTLLTLEKLCVGFKVRPDELLLPAGGKDRMVVSQTLCLDCTDGLCEYALCPGCGRTLEREGQKYCDRCGQRLDWEEFFVRRALNEALR